MNHIKNDYEQSVLGYDDNYLYYHDRVPEDEMEPGCSVSINQLKDKNTGGLKLNTIVSLQEELGLIRGKVIFLKEKCLSVPFLSQIILNLQNAIREYNNRVILFESEGSGPASAWKDIMFIRLQDANTDLYSSRLAYLSASEVLDYFGLSESEYWDSLQPNGENILCSILQIKNANELYDSITTQLNGEEQWDIKKEQIKWNHIVNTLIKNNMTTEIGQSLKKILQNRNGFN